MVLSVSMINAVSLSRIQDPMVPSKSQTLIANEKLTSKKTLQTPSFLLYVNRGRNGGEEIFVFTCFGQCITQVGQVGPWKDQPGVEDREKKNCRVKKGYGQENHGSKTARENWTSRR